MDLHEELTIEWRQEQEARELLTKALIFEGRLVKLPRDRQLQWIIHVLESVDYGDDAEDILRRLVDEINQRLERGSW